MWRFFKFLRLAFWRALEHDQFAVAKAAAYSAIITLFPAVAVVAAILAASNTTVAVVTEVSYALGRILPANTSEALRGYFEGNKTAQVSVLIPAFLGTLWTASGVMISWMDGFRRAYQMPKIWGMVKERLIAFLMVLLAGLPMTFASFLVAFGNLDDLSQPTLAGALHPGHVDSGALDDIDRHQHCRYRAYLSSRTAAYPTMAPRAAGLGAGDRAVVQRHDWLWVVYQPLRPL
jgi:membrane protein